VNCLRYIVFLLEKSAERFQRQIEFFKKKRIGFGFLGTSNTILASDLSRRSRKIGSQDGSKHLKSRLTAYYADKIVFRVLRDCSKSESIFSRESPHNELQPRRSIWYNGILVDWVVVFENELFFGISRPKQKTWNFRENPNDCFKPSSAGMVSFASRKFGVREFSPFFPPIPFSEHSTVIFSRRLLLNFEG